MNSLVYTFFYKQVLMNANEYVNASVKIKINGVY